MIVPEKAGKFALNNKTLNSEIETNDDDDVDLMIEQRLSITRLSILRLKREIDPAQQNAIADASQ